MRTVSYHPCYKNSIQEANCFLRSYKVLLLFASLLTFSKASAQYNSTQMNLDGQPRSAYAIVGGVMADIPQSNLKDVYKVSPGFEAGVLRYKNNFVFGVHVGFRSFNSKYPEINEYDATTGSLYSTTYISNYSSLAIFSSIAYELSVGRRAKLSAGVNVGNYISHYNINYVSTDAETNGGYDITETQAYGGPDLGIHLAINEDLQLNVHARYNVFGNYSYTYNSRYGDESSGIIYTSVSAGLGLIYRLP